METLHNPKEVKAKKDHRCDFCSEKIISGSIYKKSTHAHEGSVYDWKTHVWCDKLANTLDMYEDAYDGLSGDMFQEIVHDHYIELLCAKLPKVENWNETYSDIVQGLIKVPFRDKLWCVIRHYNKLQEHLKEK